VASAYSIERLFDIEYEIELAGEAVASVGYPHQQFSLE
jgi:hypothetical protein